MRINDSLSKRLFNIVRTHKKVSHLGFMEDEFIAYINTFNAINGLDEDCYDYQNIPLSKWEVPDCLKGFIIPAKVSLTGARSETDLLVRPTLSVDDKTLNLTNFRDITSLINSSMKIELSKVVSVEALRSFENITTAGVRQMVDGKVRENSTSFFPLEFTTEFIKSGWLTYSAEDMVDEFLRKILRG